MEGLFRNYKVYVITIFILISIYIGLNIIGLFVKKDENKEFKYSNYVKTIDKLERNNYVSELPYINLKSEDVQNINNEIASLYYKVINSDNGVFLYEYYINEDIISLLIKIQHLENNGNIIRNYISYNVNYKTQEQVNNSDLLADNNLTENNINTMVLKKITAMYQYELDNNYIKEDMCNFSCYCELRDISFPIDNPAIILKNGQLYAVIPFNIENLVNGSEPYYEEDYIYKLS